MDAVIVRMKFDRKLADKIVNATSDRDRALFFAGRTAETRAFENALAQAADKPQAVFRVYQGAPGCGKTSLAAHLAETHGDRALFVPCDPADMVDPEALVKRVRKAALDRSTAARASSIAMATASELLNIGTLAEATRAVLVEALRRDMPIALHLDEAHARAPQVGERLVSLHTSGMGVPCVVLLTGLEHTTTAVTGIPGLSRLPSDAVVPMGLMKLSECADSLRAMLEAVGARGDRDEREALAARAAPLAREWPQHLHCVHKALCEELLQVGGRVAGVDRETVRERVSAMRSDYYEARLDHPIFQIDPPMTRRIVGSVHIGSLRGADLHELCEREIANSRHATHFHRKNLSDLEFADALHEKGILSRDREQVWSVAIPSMGEWARGDAPSAAV